MQHQPPHLALGRTARMAGACFWPTSQESMKVRYLVGEVLAYAWLL